MPVTVPNDRSKIWLEDAVVAEAVFQSAQHEAYTYVRDRIMSGAYPAGMRLKPDVIAQDLVISRMPVREALRQLDSEGLVTSKPNRGVVVAALAAEDAEELIEACAVLEALSLRYAMPNLKGDTLDELKRLLERMDRARGEPRVWLERHAQFHHFVDDASGRPKISELLRRIRNQLQPCTLQYIEAVGREELEGHEHHRLIEAFEAGDVDAAAECMRQHVREFRHALIGFLTGQQVATAQKGAGKKRIAA